MKRIFMVAEASLLSVSLLFGGSLASSTLPLAHAATVNFDLDSYLFVIGAGAIFNGGLTTNVVNVAFTKGIGFKPNSTVDMEIVATDMVHNHLEAATTKVFTAKTDSSGDFTRSVTITMEGPAEAKGTKNTLHEELTVEDLAGPTVITVNATASGNAS